MQEPGPWSERDYEAFRIESDRLGFIRKVYSILSAQLLFTAFLSLFAFLVEPYREFLQESLWFIIICLVGTIVTVLLLFCVPSLARKYPTNFMLLTLFTLFEGLLLASFTSFFEPLDVVLALFLTAGLTIVLTVYAFTTKTDFTRKTGLILVLSFSLLTLGLLFIIIPSRTLTLVSFT